jgi:hypothetical protein
MNTSTDKQLVDEAVDAYLEWREECVAVWDTYGRWKSAPRADAPLAFAAYTTALDIEELASIVYAGAIGRVGHLLNGTPAGQRRTRVSGGTTETNSR